MPPRTRSTKSTKGLKENIDIAKSNIKSVGKRTKPPRKPLSDKTNSASDDNESDYDLKKISKQTSVQVTKLNYEEKRPRRMRHLPTRYVENDVLKNLSNSKDTSVVTKSVEIHIPVNNNIYESPVKTPQKVSENSLLADRPKRVCRLPSRFEDHSISPSKFIPVQPCHASTPIVQKNNKKTVKNIENIHVSKETVKHSQKIIIAHKNKKTSEKAITQSADGNNNPKSTKVTRGKINDNKNKQSTLGQTVPKKRIITSKKVLENSLSFKLLEDKKQRTKNGKNKFDIYEFTYDPNEEPTPQKKKKKRVAKKKPPQPKVIIFKNNYDKNVSKALAALKNVVIKNKVPQNQFANNVNLRNTTAGENILSKDKVEKDKSNKITFNDEKYCKETKAVEKLPTEKSNNVPSRKEDVGEDFEAVTDHVHDHMNYSPVTSPNRSHTPVQEQQENRPDTDIPMPDTQRPVYNNDPLNLQNDLSFFDEPPIASSSMNVSVRHPLASPWRVEFGSLPIKWQNDTYVKPNMTPALESSFINFNNDKNKKHVYTNMVPESNEALPEIIEAPQLKQTSIISFIKEVIEKSEKKKRKHMTPVKGNSLFEDVTNKSINNTNYLHTPQTVLNRSKSKTPDKNTSKENSDVIYDKENQQKSRKRKNNCDPNVNPAKTPCKEKDRDCTLFGFDDTEEQDENSPPKIDNTKQRTLRQKSRAILKEINDQTGPLRAVIPKSVESKFGSEAVDKVYEGLKSAADAPVFYDKNTQDNFGANDTNINDEDSQSVHLFEDIDVVHHLKPNRKSYGKAKKVTFRQNSLSDSDTQTNDIIEQEDESEEDNLDDLTFKVPNVKPRKTAKKRETKKNKISKKEEAAIEEWAAGFNSMCEDVDDFDLIVE